MHPGEPRQEGKRHRRGAQGDRQVVEVEGDLEGDHPPGQPVGQHQQEENLEGDEPFLSQRGQGAADDHANLRVVPARPRPQRDPGVPSSPPLGGRVETDGACRAESEQQHLAKGHMAQAGAGSVDHGHGAEHGDGAQVLERRCPSGQGETATGVHHRGGGPDHPVEEDLRDEHEDQQLTHLHLS